MSESLLEAGISQLQNDRTNGARILATNALKSLQGLILITNVTTSIAFWTQIRLAGYRLAISRPSMGSAITSAITQALDIVRNAWVEELGKDWQHRPQRLKSIAQEQFGKILQNRMHTGEQLSGQFKEYLDRDFKHLERPFRILTLSSSSSLRRCLLLSLGQLQGLRIELRILESRPRCEGASFGTQILHDLLAEMPETPVLTVVIAPDSHVCKLAEGVDIVLLGADRISSSGDVSNKMGSLTAVLCAKHLSPSVKIVVVSESDKIAKPGAMKEHAAEQNDVAEVISGWNEDTQEQYHSLKSEHLVVENTYFEWVPARHIDVYIMEKGLVNVDHIQRTSEHQEELEKDIFDKEIVALAQVGI